MAGFIKLHRGWRDTDGLTASSVFSEHEAWLWLLENAAWKDMSRRSAKGEEIAVQRGQVHVSLGSLSSSWGWSKKRVRTFLDRLTKVSKVGTVKSQSGTHLTILNYCKYQDNGHSLAADQGTAGAQPGHTQEEGKERKEDNHGGDYAFEGRVIRLSKADFKRWEQAYHLIDIKAALQSRDDWIHSQPDAQRKRWFQSTSNYLAKLQQEAISTSREVDNRVC